MDIADRVALVDVVLALRQRLLDAQASGDQEVISKLLTTFGVLTETSYQYEKPTMIGLFVAFEEAARNAMMGVNWKAPVPSKEEVVKTLN